MFRLQAGKHDDALQLAFTAKKWEDEKLGQRPQRMVELLGLLADVYDEVCAHECV